MKKLLIALVIVLVLIGAVFVFAALNVNSLVNKYRPDIERAASQAVGSKVTLGKLETSIFPGVKVRIGELRVQEDPHSQPFTLSNLALHVRLLPLLGGSLDIQKLSIDKPALDVVKTKDGIQIAGLPKQKAAPRAEPAAPKTESAEPTKLPSALKLNLESFELNDAKLTFTDEVAKKTYRVSHINVAAGVALKGNVITIPEVKGSATLFEKVPLTLKGENISYDVEEGKAVVPDFRIDLLGNPLNLKAEYVLKGPSGNFSLESSGIKLASLSALAEVAPALRDFELAGNVRPSLKGELQGSVAKINGTVGLDALGAKVGDIQITDLSGDVKLAGTNAAQTVSTDNLQLKANNAPIKVAFNAALQGKEAKLQALQLEAFSGTLRANALAQLAGAQSFSSKVELNGFNIEQALAALKPALAQMVSGTLSNVTVDLDGNLGPNLVQSLNGNVRLLAEKCSFKGVNIAAEALKAVNEVSPGSNERSALPKDQQEALASPNTDIDSLSGDFKIGDATLSTQNLKLTSKIFELTGDGRVGFDAALDLNTTLAFSQPLSAALATRSPNLKKVLSASGQLVVPVTLKGTPPKIAILPNVKKLIELAGQRALQAEGDKLLGKLFGGKNKQK
jgi:uncharacterized protein YhdP